MRNTHPALFSANENRNRPEARTNVTNFRANATLPDKKSQGPLRMPGPFFVLYIAKVPIYGQTNRQNKTRQAKPEEHPPAKTETDHRHRPLSDPGNFRLPEVSRDGIYRPRIPPCASPDDPKTPSAPPSCGPDIRRTALRPNGHGPTEPPSGIPEGIPPPFSIRPVTDHNPCMGSRPPYGCPAKRSLKNIYRKTINIF